MKFPDGTPKASVVQRGGGMSPLSDPTRFRGPASGMSGY
jgi:hypothetical protein